tara:strand:- start:1758 stop:2603 length:846 start_codon:yes stop_codon:yes gene_type:complete
MNDTLQTWDDLASLEPKAGANNLLIIDGNNLAYRWIGRQNYDNFGQEYTRTIQSLAKSYNAARTIVCLDFGKSYYRKKLLETYKANRKPPSEPDEVKRYEEFFGCLNDTIDSLEYEYYKHRGIEADDLIAFFVEKEKSNFNQVWIVSSDKDLYQLVDDNVNIFNLYSRREITQDYLLEELQLTPEEHMLAKIIEGDKSDDIKGIEGIGEKRAATLARKYKVLPELLLALPIKSTAKYIKNLNAGKNTLLLNEKLVSLKKYNERAIKAGKSGEQLWNLINEG